MYRLVIHRRAARYLQMLPLSQQDSLKETLTRLSANPFQYHSVKAMRGEWQGYYRIRVRDDRVIYWIDRNDMMVYVDYIGPRGRCLQKGMNVLP